MAHDRHHFLLISRRQIREILKRYAISDKASIKLGPITLELGELAKEGKDAISRFNQISEVMAKSRILELEITESNFRLSSLRKK